MLDVPFTQDEAYVLKKADDRWYLLNVIFDTEQLGSRTIERLHKNQNPKSWEEEFSYQA